MMKLKFMLLPEVSGFSVIGTGSVVRVFGRRSVFLGDISIWEDVFGGCCDRLNSVYFVEAIFDLKPYLI